MDFFRICEKEPRSKSGTIEVYPDFIVGRSRDLMVRGQSFHAIYDPETGLWSTDEYDVQRLVDAEVMKYVEKLRADGTPCDPKLLGSWSTNGWNQFRKFMKNISDNSHDLDMKLTFANTEIKKSDYVSRRLPYSLAAGDYSAWDELVGTLYDPVEREKIEWAIGAIISGDAKKIEKFLVFYGPGGTGKSTIMKIIQKLFVGYIAMFEAKSLVGNNNSFSTEVFKSNPLVAIQHDGDLSKIDDNSKLNSVVGHDDMLINEKYKPGYIAKIVAFLFMGTNKPVKITDAKSGLIRRLIDVNPSLRTFEPDDYHALMGLIDFQLGAIAQHCLDVYRKLGKNHYSGYVPERMMLQTNVFYNFIEEHFDIFKAQDGTTLQQAWELYKAYALDAELPFKQSRINFREELKNYFDEFHERLSVDGTMARSVFRGFSAERFREPIPKSKPKAHTLVMGETESILDEMYAGLPAQYSNADGNPKLYWDDFERINQDGETFVPKPSQIVSTVLGDLDTSKLHFVKVPDHHIVIDFDLKGDDGKKSLERSKEAASSWPATYSEVSQSGNGVHLHYIYDGDVTELARVYSEDIEIKVYTGNSSLRRKLTMCNNVSVATINGGLPFREKPVIGTNTLKTEQGLRRMIIKNLKKEVHPGTKPSIDFIEHILRKAKRDGLVYDVTDMRPAVMAFAVNSTNKAPECLKAVARMEFKSELAPEEVTEQTPVTPADDRIVFFDCEVYPNLFVICWKYQGDGATVVRMINPSPADVEQLFNFKLVGFHNRGYDNHILWGRFLGATNEELYKLSQKLIDNDSNGTFGQAWGISYADVYDFSVDKKSLKKWEIELGIPHIEMDIPWDQPVPENKITQVVDYCCNDVLALEAVFEHVKQDFVARQILSDLSELPVNSSTRQHAIRIMFGSERNPQKDFVYTDLSEMFPGYEFNEFAKRDKSTYRDEVVGEGGYVYGEPGMYENVALLDIASMHPTSIIELNLFGPYTDKFKALVDSRLNIKHADEALKNDNGVLAESYLDKVRRGLDGKFKEHLSVGVSRSELKGLSDALKLVINSIYGYTCAKFDNPFRDKRNKDNIVAKRGALFMVDLKKYVQGMGYTVAHIKTDSIKIPDATPEVIELVKKFGEKYGYTFEHEATYKKLCLVNDAVYIAQIEEDVPGSKEVHWTATGAEFKHPYVFKTLFTREPINFRDLCETKQVKEGVMHLLFPKTEIPHHVGRSGSFVAVNSDQDLITGGRLVRIKDDKEYAVTGTKDHLWAESEMVRALQEGAINQMTFDLYDAVEGTGSIADVIDMSYYNELAEDAKKSINKFGSFEEFVK